MNPTTAFSLPRRLLAAVAVLACAAATVAVIASPDRAGRNELSRNVQPVISSSSPAFYEIDITGHSSNFNHDLYLSEPVDVLICSVCRPGDTAVVGPFEPGTPLEFRFHVINTDKDYFSTDATRARFNAVGPPTWTIGWEDLSDRDHNDIVHTVEAVELSGPIFDALGSSQRFLRRYLDLFYSDPVNTANGNFVQAETDLEIPGSAPLVFSRAYNSLDATGGPLGTGWTHNYDMSIEDLGDGILSVNGPDGETAVFWQSAPGSNNYLGTASSKATLTGTPTGHQLRLLDQTSFDFDTNGALASITDPTGRTITVTRDQTGRVATVTNPAARTLSFTYDANDHVTAVTADDGRISNYTYTADGLLETATNPAGRTTTYTYNADDQIIEVEGPDNNTIVANTYDQDGRVIAQTDPLGNTSSLGFDDATGTVTLTNADGAAATHSYVNGVLAEVIDPTGAVSTVAANHDRTIDTIETPAGTWTHDYDADGNLTSRTGPDNTTETWTYNPANQVTSHTDAAGNTATYTYTSANQVDTATDPAGAVTDYDYDPAGNMVTLTDPAGGVWTYTYTADGLVDTATDPVGAVTDYEYDPAGTLAKVIDPVGGERTYTHTADGLIATETDPAGAVTTYTHDDAGNVTTIATPAGTTTRTYNDAGEITTETNPLGETTTWTYDQTGNVASVTDPAGATTTYIYDGRRNPIEVVSPLGNVPGANPADHTTFYGYDGAGNLTSTASPAGVTSMSTYDSYGRILTQTTAAGTTTYTYDPAGNLASTTDPTGATTTYTYDAAGRTTSISDAAGTTTTSHDPAGRVTSTTDAAGATTTYTYDANHRQTSATSPSGVTTTTYDLAGNITAITHPDGATTTYDHDSLGRVTTTVGPRGNVPGANPADHTTTHAYDLAGNQTSTTDPLGNTTQRTHDPLGRLLTITSPTGSTVAYTYNPAGAVSTVTDPLGAKTGYTHDLNGQITAVTDHDNNTWTYDHDPDGRIVSRQSPIGQRWTHSYNSAGQLASTTNPSGHATPDPSDGTINYTYDGNGQRTGIDYSDEATYSFEELSVVADVTFNEETPDVAYTYNATGQVETMTDGDGTETYTYDPNGLLTTVTRGSTPPFAYSHDPAGNLTTRAYPTGTTLTYTYDAAGRPLTLTDQTTGETTTYQWDPAGNLTQRQLPNGLDETRTYDPNNNLTNITVTNAANSTVEDITYTYDADNNVTSRVTPTETTLYTYDTAGQLTEACNTAGGCAGPLADYTRYSYDNLGRRTTKTTPTGTTTYTYNAASQLLTETSPLGDTTTYSYDPNGNQISNGERHYVYDAADRLVAQADGLIVTHNRYNGNNLRIATSTRPLGLDATNETLHHWDTTLPGAEIIATTEADHDPISTYTHDPAGPHSITQDNTTSHYLTERLDTVTALTNTTGQPTQTYGYTPYGERTTATTNPNAPDSPYGFTGEVHDPNGLIYLRNRHYNPNTGNFTTTDPLDGVPGTTTHHNPYHYANNNPTNLTDPLGLRPQGVGAGGLGAGPACAYDDGVYRVGDPPEITHINWLPNGGCRPVRTYCRGIQAACDFQNTAIYRVIDGVSQFAPGRDCVDILFGDHDAPTTALCGVDVIPIVGKADIIPDLNRILRGSRNPSGIADDVFAVCRRSFSADTEVLLGDGTTTKPISELEPGDEVWATDPVAGESGPRRVEAVWPHYDWLLELDVEGGSVTTTEDHHFWNATDREWQETQHLNTGDLLLTSSGERLAADSLDWSTWHYDEAFDLTIEGFHSYYVGADGEQVLVHNCDESLASAASGSQRALASGRVGALDTAGVSYTNHFADRLALRNIAGGDALDTINTGRTFYDPKYGNYIRYNSRTKLTVILRGSPDGPAHSVFYRDNPASRWNPYSRPT